MRLLKYVSLLAVASCLLFVSPPKSHAQVAIQIGAEPVCPYGYYDYAPYPCAPYGYYGPEWFSGGVFIGAGPWFHGPHDFHGKVDNHYDVHNGYHGPMPQRGEHSVQHPHSDFHGNEMRDGRGHADSGHADGGHK
jgi:hypothetical protein